MLATLKLRLPVALVGLAVVSAMVMGVIGWQGASSGLAKAALDRLTLAADTRTDLLKLVEDRLQRDIGNLAGTALVASSIPELDKNLELNPAEFEKTQAYFTGATPDERIAKDGADSQTMYGFRHAKIHRSLASALTAGDIRIS